MLWISANIFFCLIYICWVKWYNTTREHHRVRWSCPMYNTTANIDILGRVRSGGGEGKRNFADPRAGLWCGTACPSKGSNATPTRSERKINSSGVSCAVYDVCMYVYMYVSPLYGAGGVGRGEDENGTVIAKGRGCMMTLIARDSRDRCSRLLRKIMYWSARSWNTLRCVSAIGIQQVFQQGH